MKDANNPTPSERENVSVESVDYESLSKRLLRQEFEEIAFGVREEFLRVSVKLGRGEDLAQEDIEALQSEIEQAQLILDAIWDTMDADWQIQIEELTR